MAKKREGQPHPAAKEVGYGRPPAEHQFKPGHKGNPWGCKGKPKPPLDFLESTITITIDGRPRPERLCKRTFIADATCWLLGIVLVLFHRMNRSPQPPPAGDSMRISTGPRFRCGTGAAR
jgi:hypothetical protein